MRISWSSLSDVETVGVGDESTWMCRAERMPQETLLPLSGFAGIGGILEVLDSPMEEKTPGRQGALRSLSGQ